MPDTNLTDHVPKPTGTSWVENVAGSFVVIDATDDLQRATAGNQSARETTDVGSNLMDVLLTNKTLPSVNDPIGVSGRHQSTGNPFDNQYLDYAQQAGSSDTQLYKVVAGTSTQLGTAAHTWVAGQVMKIEIRTAAKKFFVDATEKISSADDVLTANQFAGVFGDATTTPRDGRTDDWESRTSGGATVAKDSFIEPPAVVGGVVSTFLLMGVG